MITASSSNVVQLRSAPTIAAPLPAPVKPTAGQVMAWYTRLCADKRIPHAHKAVAWVISQRFDETGVAFCGHVYIAEKAGVAESTVGPAIRNLDKTGYFSVEYGGRNVSNRYRLGNYPDGRGKDSGPLPRWSGQVTPIVGNDSINTQSGASAPRSARMDSGDATGVTERGLDGLSPRHLTVEEQYERLNKQMADDEIPF